MIRIKKILKRNQEIINAGLGEEHGLIWGPYVPRDKLTGDEI